MAGAPETSRIAGLPARLTDVDVTVEGSHGPRRSVRLYLPADPERFIDRERLLRDGSGPEPPYWTLVWIGARVIAHRMLEDPPPRGARVLDLGCGLGASGVAAAMAGTDVTCCDCVDDCLAFVEASARANGLDNLRTRRLDFTCDRLPCRFDLILAADVVYDPAHYAALATFLDGHVARDGTILVTESLRADAARFLDRMRALGYRDERRGVWIAEDGRRERTWLHVLGRSHPSLEILS